jgi:hypothetical protein
MTRWHVTRRYLPRMLTILASMPLVILSLPLAAQNSVRHFPNSAQRGEFEVISPPNVLMDGKPVRLSPGARIKNPNNILVLSASLVGKKLIVNYLMDFQGMIHEVWILNTTEAQLTRGSSKVQTNIIFDSTEEMPHTDDGKTQFDLLPIYQVK